MRSALINQKKGVLQEVFQFALHGPLLSAIMRRHSFPKAKTSVLQYDYDEPHPWARIVAFSVKVLLRWNFDVMFITKNHLYQLIKEDCNLKYDWNEDFHPTNWKNWPWKVVFSRLPLWIYVPMSLRYRAAATRYWPIVFLSWRHFLNSHWSFLA